MTRAEIMDARTALVREGGYGDRSKSASRPIIGMSPPMLLGGSNAGD